MHIFRGSVVKILFFTYFVKKKMFDDVITV
jgi:hypothetical protein